MNFPFPRELFENPKTRVCVSSSKEIFKSLESCECCMRQRVSRIICLSQLQSQNTQRIKENELVNMKAVHRTSVHKIMSNKHHLREFRIAFYVFMKFLLLAFYIWVLISGRNEEKMKTKCMKNIIKAKIKKRRPDSTTENWIIKKKTVQLIWECWWDIK